MSAQRERGVAAYYAMNLFLAHAHGIPLVVDTGPGGNHLMAEIFRIRGGVVFADIGWPEASFHAFHTLKGRILETKDGWTVGAVAVRVAFAGEQRYEDWQQWLALREARGWTRRLCAREIAASGLLSPSDAARLPR